MMPARSCALLLLLLALAQHAGAAAFDFMDSDFVFSRATSDVPFVPLAWLDVNSYQDSTLHTPSGDLPFRQASLSEATLLPVLLGRRDALLVGQWGTWTQLSSAQFGDTEAGSISLPIGWARQASPDWQLAAFVAPTANVTRGHWYWDYMGGVFARYLGQSHVAWVFGLYSEITPPEAQLYVPYLGVTWTINRHWTLSGILPWPAILYSPTPDWLLRLGFAPSSASWITDVPVAGEAPRRLRTDLTSWDFGFRVEKRAWKGIWVGAETGLSGFRGFAFSGGEWQHPRVDLASDPYVVLTVTFRPSLADVE